MRGPQLSTGRALLNHLSMAQRELRVQRAFASSGHNFRPPSTSAHDAKRKESFVLLWVSHSRRASGTCPSPLIGDQSRNQARGGC